MRSRVLRVLGSFAALLTSALVVLACETPPASLHVDVETDLVPGLEVASLEAEVQRDGAVVTRSSPLALGRADADAWLERGMRIASFDRLPSGLYTVRVIAREPAAPGLPIDGGPILMERSVLVSIEASRVVRVVLGARCADLECPDGDEPELTACVNGRCVSPRCDLTPGESCDDPGPCAEGDPEACSEPPPCATATCRAGACFNVPIEGACADGEYCGRFGCEPIPGAPTPDAGVPDAWVEPPDAPLPPDAAGPCGVIGSACSDGNPCTSGDVCTATGCAGTPQTGTSCGTNTQCRTFTCMAGACRAVNASNGTACGTRTGCRADTCSGGECTRFNVRDGTACTDGDSNACTSGECATGSCRAVRRPDGTDCGTGNNMCCSGNCIDPDSNGSHCGVCGVSCGGRGCNRGFCRCSTNPQCTAELGGEATCWDSTEAGDPAGMNCQCQCASGTTCAACPGGARCREETGYNRCYFP